MLCLELKMDIEQRFKYYLGSNTRRVIDIETQKKYSEFGQNNTYFYKGSNAYPEGFRFEHGFVHPGWWWGHNNGFMVDFPCLTNSADGYESHELPVLTKARRVGDTHGILLKFEYDYHWKILENFKDDIPFESKIDDVIWRGTDLTSLNKTYNRRDFVERYYAKYNVAFSIRGPENNHDYVQTNAILFKDRLSVEEQLKFKYLICLEGNDVATSLKWSLLSNSVVIMAPPKTESWLMEGLLKPYVHYVPLRDDFSDLDEVVEWCRANQEKCKEITKNATEYMQSFLNQESERLLFNRLCNWYQENVQFASF